MSSLGTKRAHVFERDGGGGRIDGVQRALIPNERLGDERDA